VIVLRLPPSYALRNLRRRPWHSILTVAGIGVVVFASCLMLALVRGLSGRIDVAGETQNVLAISRAGQNIMFSSIPEDELVDLGSLPGIARDDLGNPLVSAETMHMSMVECETASGTRRAPLYLRGVGPRAYGVHRCMAVSQGRLPEAEEEILAGATAYIKLGVPREALLPGRKVSFENHTWTVCGVFEAGGSLIESEIWMQEPVLLNLLRRRTHTFAVVRFPDEAAVRAAVEKFHQTGAVERFFKGWSEREYYRQFGAVLAWVQWLAVFMVAVITLGGALIGANTMYTAVVSRIPEIATYRVLGFDTADILATFVIESAALALLGGGAGVASAFALNGLPLSLSHGAFFLVVDPLVALCGLGLALAIGVLGGFFPALRGVRMTCLEGLRHA
jgi:ABC-type lipoprotein release transport system permease subunit